MFLIETGLCPQLSHEIAHRNFLAELKETLFTFSQFDNWFIQECIGPLSYRSCWTTMNFCQASMLYNDSLALGLLNLPPFGTFVTVDRLEREFGYLKGPELMLKANCGLLFESSAHREQLFRETCRKINRSDKSSLSLKI